MKPVLSVLIVCLFCSMAVMGQNANNKRYVESEEVKNLQQDTPVPVRIATYRFKKLVSGKSVVEFTELDALKLEKFFMEIPGMLSCTTDALDKQVKVISRRMVNGEEVFYPQNLVDRLQLMGYAVISLKTSDEDVIFVVSRRCKNTAVVLSSGADLPESVDCNDCGKQKVSKELLDKFKDADYGGEMIDFGNPGMDTTVDSDQN